MSWLGPQRKEGCLSPQLFSREKTAHQGSKCSRGHKIAVSPGQAEWEGDGDYPVTNTKNKETGWGDGLGRSVLVSVSQISGASRAECGQVASPILRRVQRRAGGGGSTGGRIPAQQTWQSSSHRETRPELRIARARPPGERVCSSTRGLRSGLGTW